MALSIEIRNNSVHVIQAKTMNSRVVCRKAVQFDLPSNIIDAKGITDIDQFSLALGVCLENNGIKEKKCTLCINNLSVIYRELTIPQVDDKKIPFIVRSETISSLNLTNEYIIDYIILEEFVEENKPMLRILAVAIQGIAIESYLEAMYKLKIKPTVIESSTSSAIKLVDLCDFASNGEPIVVADVENGYLKLYLFEEGRYILTRNTKLFDYSLQDKDQVVDIIEDNINKMIQFQFTRSSHKGLSKIILFGSDDLVEEVQKGVTENLQIECALFPLPEFLVNETGIPLLPYMNAIGALLRK